MMAHKSGYGSKPGTSKDKGARLSADDLKIPIIKVLLEQGFSEEDVTLGLAKYRKRHPDHDKVNDTYVLDLVTKISKSNSKDRTSDPNLNKKKQLQANQSKGSTWIDELQARNNKVFHRNVEIRLPQNLSRKFEKSTQKRVQICDDEETTSTDADNEESSDENAKIKTVSKSGTKSDSRSNGMFHSVIASSDSTASESEIIEVTERVTPVTKKLSKKPFRFDTASNDSDSQREQDIAKSSPCKAADKTKSADKSRKNLKSKVRHVPADVTVPASNKRKISSSDSCDESLLTKQHDSSKDKFGNETNNIEIDQGQAEFVKPSDKAKAMLKKLKLSREDMDKAKNFIHSIVEVSPIKGVKPFQSVNVRKNSYIKEKMEREMAKSSKNKVTPPQSTDSSSGNEFDSPVVSVKKYKKRKPVLLSSSSEDDIEKEKPVKHKRSPRKRLKKHFDSSSNVTSSQSTVQEDDLTAGSSNECEMPQTVKHRTERNLSSVSTVCDDSDVSTVCEEDSDESLSKNTTGVSSKKTSGLKTLDSKTENKTSVVDDDDGSDNEIDKENYIEEANSSSSDELPELPFNRNSQKADTNLQKPSIISESKTTLKKFESAYEQDTEKYSDYEIASVSDSDEQANKTKEEQRKEHENDKFSIKPINMTTTSFTPSNSKNVKPLSTIPAVKSLISHSPDMYSIRSLKTSSGISLQIKKQESKKETNRMEDEGDLMETENSKSCKTNKSNNITDELGGVTDSSLGISNEGNKKSSNNDKNREFINLDDPSDDDTKETVSSGQVERQNFGYTQDDDCIYVTDDSDTENIYNSLSQQVIHITDDEEDDDDDNDKDVKTKGEKSATVDDRDDDSDIELSKFFDVHETDDDDYDDNEQTAGRNKNRDMRSDSCDPEYMEIFGEDDATQNNDEDEFDELMKGETKIGEKSPKTNESSDSAEDEFDELLQENDKIKEIKKHRDFSDEDDDPFENLTRPDRNENRSRSHQSVTHGQNNQKTPESGNNDKKEYHQNKNSSKQSNNSSERNVFESNLTKCRETSSHNLYSALTQLVTTTISSKKMAGKTLVPSRQEDLYQAETQQYSKDLNDFDQAYDLQTQVSDRNKERTERTSRQEMYEAETQVCSDVSDDSEIYELQTQVTHKTGINVTTVTNKFDYNQQTQVNETAPSDEPDLAYDEQTQVDHDTTFDEPDYEYDKQTQVNHSTISNESDAEYEDPYGGLTQIDDGHLDKVKHGIDAKKNNTIDNAYFEATQSYRDDQEVDPYAEATQIDSGDSSVCIVDSDSSPIKVSRLQRNAFETTVSLSDETDDEAFSSLTQIDNDDNRSQSESGEDDFSVKNKSLNSVAVDETLSSSDNENESEFFGLTQVDHLTESCDPIDPYEQCTQLDNDNVFAKFASNKDAYSEQVRENKQTPDRQNSSELRNKNSTPVRLSSSTPQRTASVPSRKIIELPLQRLKSTQEKRESLRLEKEKFYSKTQTDTFKNDSDKQSTSVSLNKNMFYSKSSSSSSSSHSKNHNRNVVQRSSSLDSKTKKRHGSGSVVQNKSKRPKVGDEQISMTQQVNKAREEMEKRIYKAASNPAPVAKQKKQQVTEVIEHSDVTLPSNEEIIKKGLPVLYSPQKRQRNLNTTVDNFDRSSAFAKSYDNDSQEETTSIIPGDKDNHQEEINNTTVVEKSVGDETEKEMSNKQNSSSCLENTEKKVKEKRYSDLRDRDRDREKDKDDRKKEKDAYDKERDDKNNRRKGRDRDSNERVNKHKDSRATEKDKDSRNRDKNSDDRMDRRKKDSKERDTSYKEREKESREREKIRASSSKDNSGKGREKDKEQDKVSSSKNKLDKEKEKVSSSKDNKNKSTETNYKDKEKEKASTSKGDKETREKRNEEKTNINTISTDTRKKQEDEGEKTSQAPVNSEVKNDSDKNVKTSQQAKTSSSVIINESSVKSRVKTTQQAKTSSSVIINESSVKSSVKTTQHTKSIASVVVNDKSTESNTKSILKVSTTENTKSKSVKFTLPEVSLDNSSAGTLNSNNLSFVKSGTKTISIDAYKNRQGMGNSDSSANKELAHSDQHKIQLSSGRLNGSHIRTDNKVMQQKYGFNKPNLMEKVTTNQSSIHTGKENHPRLQPFVAPNQSASSSSPQYQPPPNSNKGNIYAELQQKFGAHNYVDYFWYRLLKWNPRWLFESEDPLLAGVTPPIVEATDCKLTHIPETFDSFDDYYKIIVPHLLHEAWEMCLRDWKEIKAQKKSLCQKFYLNVHKHPVCPDLIYYTVQGILPKDQVDKGLVLKESSLIILTTVSRNPTNQGQLENFSQFAVIERVETHKQPRQIRLLLDSSKVLAEEAKKLRKELVLVQYTLKLRKRPKKLPFTKDCELELLSPLVTISRQLNAMMLLPKNPLCMDILQPGKTPSVFNERAVVTPANDRELTNYNVSQRQAICTVSMIARLEPIQRRICLLQGPPGTGKSHTIIGIIKKIMRDSNFKSNIILCAPSNGAVDELLRRLENAKDQHQSTGARFPLSMVRVGNSISPEFKRYSISELVKEKKKQKMEENILPSTKIEMDRLWATSRQLRESISYNIRNKQDVSKMEADLQKMERKLHGMEQEHLNIHNSVHSPEEEWKIEHKILKNANVICGTLNSMGRTHLQKMLIGKQDSRQDHQDAIPFKCIIIDEATQATEVDCLIPLMYKCSKLIMVGDPEQLPPTILSKEADEKDFGLSLFERIYNHFKVREDSPVLLLNTQYRMDPEIIKFTSRYVYEGKLQTDKSVIDRCQNVPLKPYILFDLMEGQEQSTSAGSISNPEEVEFTFKLCSYILRNTKITESRIGIIAPYQEQKALLQSELGCYKIEVGTVDGFQGREKDVIILSCVRARSATGGIGFLNSRKRMNVAFTRARYALYVVGHMASLRTGGADWNNLIADASKRNVIYPVKSRRDFSTAVMYCMKSRSS